MPALQAQQIFNGLDKKLWTAADTLRSNLGAAVDNHAVIGIVFPKYVSHVVRLLGNRTLKVSFVMRITTTCSIRRITAAMMVGI